MGAPRFPDPSGRWRPEKGHPLSKQFRTNLNFMSSYAENMDSYIKHEFNLLRNEIESLKDEMRSSGFSTPRRGKWSPFGEEGYKGNEVADDDERLYKEEDDDGFDPDRAYKEEFEDRLLTKELEISHIAGYYPQVLCRSLFIAIYSLFERYLINLCNDVCESERLGLKPEALSEKGIWAARTYLNDVAGLTFPDDAEEWSVIRGLSKLRNDLAHDIGRSFDKDNKKDVNPKLLDYFWLDDDIYLEDLDLDLDSPMFSVGSIKNVLSTLSRFSNFVDKSFEERDKVRQKFRQGPKHKK